MGARAKVRTCLWFDSEGEAAAEFYVSLLPDSFIEHVSRPDPEAAALTVAFTLAGAAYLNLNGGPMYSHSPAASISVLTADQAETDRLWQALLADGGEESMCGWLVDRWGVSWQIVPEMLPPMFEAEDRAAAGRMQEALILMRRIDIAALEAAFRG